MLLPTTSITCLKIICAYVRLVMNNHVSIEDMLCSPNGGCMKSPFCVPKNNIFSYRANNNYKFTVLQIIYGIKTDHNLLLLTMCSHNAQVDQG